ncbi:MAG TPA: CsgG/HfaB family protein [Gemmatimonadaceae bacterium]|jgi:TolB-like protein|nr:CsgG/HfaB family protein [Gemmatimonadaceae bacterium]
MKLSGGTMLRTLSHTSRCLAAAALVAVPAMVRAQADNRPVVVVFTFTNSSIGAGHAEFDGISSGVQDLLITDLASNSKIRLVDRGHVAEVLQEQKMIQGGQIDPTTAVRLGKIMGAQYAITGGFISDGHGKAVLTGRTIDIETTQIANPQKIQGSTDNVLGLIADLSSKLSSDMNLAPKPGRRVGDAGSATKSAPTQSGSPAGSPAGVSAPGAPAVTYAKATSPSVVDKTNKVKLDIATMKVYSSGLDQMDKSNNAAAAKSFQQVLAKYPDFDPAQRNLDKVTGKTGNN